MGCDRVIDANNTINWIVSQKMHKMMDDAACRDKPIKMKKTKKSVYIYQVERHSKGQREGANGDMRGERGAKRI